ncbi:hypothetical protein [Spiroplasma endosymbiont of Melieria omissa]
MFFKIWVNITLVSYIRKILPNYWPNIKKAIDFVFQDMSKHYFS